MCSNIWRKRNAVALPVARVRLGNEHITLTTRIMSIPSPGYTQYVFVACIRADQKMSKFFFKRRRLKRQKYQIRFAHSDGF